MPFNGSGLFTRVYNWTVDAGSAIPITASRVDTEDNGFATGLSNCICKDGQTTITANLPMNGFTHTGVGNATATNQYASYGQLLNSITPGGFTNKIRNNSFLVSSRGTSGTITAGSPAYTLDGWMLFAGSANITWSQSGTLGYPALKSLSITGNTGVTNTQLYQRIESIVAGYVDGQQITFQASITNNTGATITPTLIVSHANASDNWGATTTDLSVSLQSIANGATAKVAYTYTAASNSYFGLQFILDFGAILNSVAKSVSVSNVDVRVTPGITTGLNNSPSPVEIIDITAEKLRCARYLPAFASTGTDSPIPSIGITSATATINNILIPFPVPTRVAVTGVTVSAASHLNTTDSVVYSLAVSAVVIGTSLSNTQALIAVTQSGVGTTIGRGATLKFNNASGLMIFTGAEL